MEIQARENWGSRFGAIMSLAGMSFGLGSIWRFPYLAGEYGGGAFVLAYIIVMAALLFPLALVEIAVGKGMEKGVMNIYKDVYQSDAVGRVLGGLSVMVILAVNFFFIFIMALCLYFMFACATGLWDSIPPEQLYDHALANKHLMFALFIVVCLTISYVVYRGVGRGIEAISKKIVPAEIILFTFIAVYAVVAIPNIEAGYNFYLNPDFYRLASFDLWAAAIGQGLFAVGVGPGCLLVYGSRLGAASDVSLTAVNLCMLVLAGSLIAGLAILPACIALGLDPAGGSQLIFVVLPTLLSQIPFGNVIGFLLFLAILGCITSAVANLEVPVTTFMDRFNWPRGKTVKVFTLVTIMCSTPAVYSEEILLFWQKAVGDYGYAITAGIGATSYSWVYGVRRIREKFINPTSDFRLPASFDYWMRFGAVPIMIFILVNSLFRFI